MLYKKIFIFFLILIGFCVLVSEKVRANTCSGSGSRTVTDEWCVYESWSRTYSCGSRTFTDSNTCVKDSSGYCGWNTIPECDCVLSSDKKSCDEQCRPASNTFFYTGCTTCVTVDGTDGACTSYPSGVCSLADITDKCTSSETNSSGITGSYSWTCYGTDGKCGGSDGANAPCSTSKITAVAGAAGVCNAIATSTPYCDYASIPTKCDNDDTPNFISDDLSGGIKWSCDGTNVGEVCGGGAGATTNCSTTKTTPVKGAAGVCNTAATSNSYCAYENIATKCDVGSATLVSDDISGGIKWTCSGTIGGAVCGGGAGATVNCGTTKIAPITRVDGVCSGINGTVVQAKPSSDLCNPGTPSPVPVNTSLTTYSWTCYGTNGVCPASTAINRPCSATQDTPPVPTITPIPVPPGITDPVPNPSGGVRLQNCQFSNSNSITFSFAVTDANGIGDVAGVYFRFKGLATEYGPETPNASGVVTFSNINVSSLTDGTYTIQAKANDVHYADIGSAWVDLAFQFKKWDCQVEVDGELYDSSAETGFLCQAGSDIGFTKLIDVGLSFPVGYGNPVNENKINMTLASPYFTARKTNNNTLTWQNTYFLSNETTSNYPGELKASKIGETCVSPSVQFSLSNYVNAYDNLPKVNIKYTAVMDQEAWFRVKDGSVLAKVEARNYVPVTCVTDCKTAVNGLVWSKKVNLSDSDESLTSEVQPQPPFGEDYEDLKYDINSGINIGTTIAGSVNWSGVGSTRGVIFVGGDLTIDQNMVLGANDYVFFIVKGTISITENVTQVTGMFFADGLIQASGQNATQLNIMGSLYSETGIILDRTFNPKRDNNSKPVVEVTYDPNLIFRLPKKLWELYENWTLE